MYTITYNQTYISTTLINTIRYTHSSHCIIVTLQTCIEQQHIDGSNTQNRYMYIQGLSLTVVAVGPVSAVS